MSNDTHKTSVYIKPADIIILLHKHIMHFDGLDVVYKTLHFNHYGYVINLHEQYSDTFLSEQQTKDLECLKTDAKNAGLTLNLEVSSYLVPDIQFVQFGTEDNKNKRNTWWHLEFGHKFKKMADAIFFFENYHQTPNDTEDSEDKIYNAIRHFLTECLGHL